jgi:hypothetical protein
MKPLFSKLSLFFMFFGAAALQAQQAPKPAPELKKLEFFVGTWNSQGEVMPGPTGPGGKITMTEHAQWMDGHFFVVTHSTYKGPMGNGSAIAVTGYKPDEKVYTYDEYTSQGEAEHVKGTIHGDTWTWNGQEKMGDQVMTGRFTMKITSPTSYNFKFEMSKDGATWNTVMSGTSTKAK